MFTTSKHGHISVWPKGFATTHAVHAPNTEQNKASIRRTISPFSLPKGPNTERNKSIHPQDDFSLLLYHKASPHLGRLAWPEPHTLVELVANLLIQQHRLKRVLSLCPA